jgi:putative membrane protein
MLAKSLVGIVALIHIYFLVLEMFLWTKPKGLKTFSMTKDFANSTAVLAANQGLYNGFLAAGLLWSLFADPTIGFQLAIFFLSCALIAALYGAYSVGIKILYIQGLPALAALISILWSK